MWFLVLALSQEPDPFIERAEAAAARLADAGPQEQQRCADVLAAYARDPNPKVSAPAVDALARYVREAAAARLADAGLQEQQRWADVLAAYARDPNPKLSTPAVDALARYVRASLGKTEAPALRTALDIVHTGRPELVIAVVQSGLPGWTRSLALRHVEDLPFLRGALADPQLTGSAALRIGEVARGSRDADLLRRLLAEGESIRDDRDLACVAWALRAVGGDDAVRPALAPWIDRLRGWNRTDVAWCVRKTDPLRVIDRLVELGALPRPDPDRLERSLSVDTPVAWIHAAFKVTGGLAGFNVARLDEPLNYAAFLGIFADASRGQLKPEDVKDEKGTLTFTHHGRAYKAVARDLGDWYDLPPLFKAVNQALEDDDIPERFVGLDHGPQLAVFVLTVPDRFERAAQEFLLPLEPDPDAARKRWLIGR